MARRLLLDLRLPAGRANAGSGAAAPDDTAFPPASGGDSLERLLAATARGDERAFRRLYDATADALYGVALRILRRSDWAQEVLQESYVSVWRHAARFDRARGAPMTWMIRIVRNQSFDWIHPSRADGRERDRVPFEWSDDDAAPAEERACATVLEGIENARSADRVSACLAALDAPQRQGISLVFFHGLSHGELAAHLHQPLGTVKAWVRRGLKRLRACLADVH